MQVALVGPVYPFRGGIAHYTTMLYRALRERGDDVMLVSFKRQYPRWLFPGQSDKDPSEKPLKVEEARYWIDSLNPFTWLATFGRIRRYRPDVIILQWWITFWAPVWFTFGILNRLFLHKPLVYICHNVLPHEARWWDALLAKAALRWGTWFTVQSLDEQAHLHSLLPGARTRVIPLPLFDMFAEDRVPQEQARQRLGLPSDAPVLLFFGFVREYKGLMDVLEALPEVRARLGAVILLVAGEFWEDKQLYLETIERLGVSDSVLIDDRYLPNEEVAIYFSAADALVAPYRRMTGSAVVQMARGFGLPVVTTSAAEAQEDGPEAMIVVAPGDQEALSREIVRLLTATPKPLHNRPAARTWEDIAAIVKEACGEER